MHSRIAAASCSGVALGICFCVEVASIKMGRTNRVQFGQMAGAPELRFALKMPATKVPASKQCCWSDDTHQLYYRGSHADVDLPGRGGPWQLARRLSPLRLAGSR